MSVAIENVSPRSWIRPDEELESLNYGPEKLFCKFALDQPVSEEMLDPNVLGVIFSKVPKRAELTYSLTALEKLGILPEKIPPVPQEALEFMSSVCPYHKGVKKVDGTSVLVIDKWFLFLKPPYSLNVLEERLNAYAHDKLGIQTDNHPFRFLNFWFKDRLGDTTSGNWEWVAITKGVVMETPNKIFSRQMEVIKKGEENANEPTLSDAAYAEFLYKVATDGGSLFPERNDQNGTRWTYTWVTEKINGLRLFFGGSAPSGVYVDYDIDCNDECIGIGAVRKFS